MHPRNIPALIATLIGLLALLVALALRDNEYARITKDNSLPEKWETFSRICFGVAIALIAYFGL
jgi:Flp pilus assembly protein protease CpaA